MTPDCSSPHANLTIVGPGTDPDHVTAIMRANSLGVQKNNESNAAREQGQLGRALQLHLEALDLKIRAFGEHSIQAAISFNTLAETYVKIGSSDELDSAEEGLGKALLVRNERELGGAEQGTRIDAAVSRDNLARVLEAKGKMDEARKARMADDAKSRILCGADGCGSVGYGYNLRSARDFEKCGACRAVFYCGSSCQKQDWTRHKPFCKAYSAANPAQ